MRISDWSSDVCSSDLRIGIFRGSYDLVNEPRINFHGVKVACRLPSVKEVDASYPWTARIDIVDAPRSEEHTSELQSLMRISYAVLCLKKKNKIAATTES